MSAVDVRCPACGTVNKSVDLEETDGWMECESCGEVTQQMKYVTNSGPGEGLIRYDKVLLPFTDKFPTDTEMYRLMTTKPTESA